MKTGPNQNAEGYKAGLKAIDKTSAVARAALVRVAVESNWPTEELKFRLKCLHRHQGGRHRLYRLIQKGDTRAIQQQDRMLNSYAGRLSAFLEEVVSSKPSSLAPMAVEALDEQVGACRPTRRLHECARLHVQSKANGSKRSVISPGPRTRASQRLVGHVLSAWQMGSPYEHNQCGRGSRAAVQSLIQLIEGEGLRHLVLFDIENFFASVKQSHLDWLPLPWPVIRHSVLFNRNAILLSGKAHQAEAEAARQGLPQGARLSGDIASALLGRELSSLSGAGGIVTYVDDGVIGACSPAGAENLAKALKMRFSNHPGGPLSFKKLDVVDVEEGFSFLGYWIRLRLDGCEPKVRVRPSHEAKQKLKRGVFERLTKLGPNIDFEKATVAISEYRDNWRRAFPLWQPDAEEIQLLEDEVLCHVGDFLSGDTKKFPVKPNPLLS